MLAITSRPPRVGAHRRLGRHGAILLSFLAAIGALYKLQNQPPGHRELVSSLWTYASTIGSRRRISILVDPLSVFMILIVISFASMIHLYSVTYMYRDRGFARFFAYMNYFVFSMLLLVLASNFLLLIIGWAFVGAASYLLISFWYRRTTATAAGIKAFVINVVGDVGLVLGTFFIFTHTDSLDFLKTFPRSTRSICSPATRAASSRVPAAARSVREIRPGSPAHVASRRDGGPDAGQRPDPRGDHGHGRRVPDRAHAPPLPARPGRPGRGRVIGARRCSWRRPWRSPKPTSNA